jgi:hypothetical protein
LNGTGSATVALRNIVVTRVKLVATEQVFERAKQGHKKALGADNTATYQILSRSGSLFEYRFDLVKTRTIYSKALPGYERVIGRDHPKS